MMILIVGSFKRGKGKRGSKGGVEGGRDIPLG
jgi:hypothetical protein